MSGATKHILVVGGGTAGWLTAAMLAKQHGSGIKISLVESSNIPTVGVGEGTWPSMRTTLQRIGLSESEFIKSCAASFKQGSRFVNWVADSHDEYYHPFTQPAGYGKLDMPAYWQRHLDGQLNFCDAVTYQAKLCRAGLAPKSITHKEYETVANYGYHLDAGKFAELLKNHSVNKLGVQHLIADVGDVELDEDGFIAAVLTEQGQRIEADFFVDCSGFRSLLLGQTLGVPFVSQQSVLFADTALAAQVPYLKDDEPIACQTISTAQTAGWIWDIGLQNRRGVGYVYSSEFCSEEQAQQTLRQYIARSDIEYPIRKISFESGHRAHFWDKNCVAIGLSAGFLEPLEASALMLVETSATFITDQLPLTRQHMLPLARRFNEVFLAKWRGVIDFLKLHYVLSQRPEPFWQGNKAPQSIPDSLQEHLQLWQFGSPNEYDFLQDYEAFSAASYQYVLYGAGYRSDYSLAAHGINQDTRALKQFELNQRQFEQMAYRLPRHRDLINQVISHGFAKL